MAPDVKIREALSDVGQYLSDVTAPVQAIEPVLTLLKQPAHLMASEIIGWVAAQNQGGKGGASVADYLFHAVSKLRYLAHLQLVAEQDLAPYLESVKELLMSHCPPEDRRLLKENFGRLGMGMYGKTEAAPISFIHRLMKSGESESATQDGSLGERPRDRRMSILQDRLKVAAGKSVPPGGDEDREDLIPLLIATAASDIRNSDEFRRLQETLESLGINSGTEQIFRTLSRSLPGWMIASTGAEAAKSDNPAIQAMCQIICFAGDRWEGRKRFQDMVQAAIEQFNTGSLARAATMFDLALGIVSNEKLDPDSVASARKAAHDALDMNRLRSLAKKRDKHRLLRKVLNFFDEFAVKNLLDSLREEEKRDRRRLLLDLLVTHGDAARKMALEKLKELLASTNVATDWYFARNLVYILNEIPRAGDVPLKDEIGLVAPLLRLSLSAPLVKEVIRYAGLTRCSESEELLISTADRLEKIAFEYAGSGRDPTQKLALLDRTILTLAHHGTPKAYKRVVKHGISCHEELGNTAARLAYLSGRDLTADKESLVLLIQFLKSKTPRKLLGLTISKNEQLLIYAIKALSSTPAPMVRETFEHIAARFPEKEFGRAAAAALKEFESSDKPATSADRMLSGDLDLFGLPDLLQQLSQLQVTGTLALKDAEGNPIGTFSLLSGRMQDCSAGGLQGEDAAYQLLEKPAAGTFVFHGQRNSGIQGSAEECNYPELNSVVAEGMRRYDELQRARAIVPDFAVLKRKSPETMPHIKEDETDLFNLIWPKTAGGTSPEECGAACHADSYRIRTLLARCVEEGILSVE